MSEGLSLNAPKVFEVLGHGDEDQREPGGASVVLQDPAVDRSEEPQIVAIPFVGRGFGVLPGNPVRQVDRVEGVSIPFIEFHLLTAEAEDLIAVRRLDKPQDRLDVKAVGDDAQLGHRPLEPVGAEGVGRAEHGQAVEGVIPELAILVQGLEWLQERPELAIGMFLAK